MCCTAYVIDNAGEDAAFFQLKESIRAVQEQLSFTCVFALLFQCLSEDYNASVVD